MVTTHNLPAPTHVGGIVKGEETALKKGREAGRTEEIPHRTARDSTGINARQREPIMPGMPHIPPA